jgi:hypothetical protein
MATDTTFNLPNAEVRDWLKIDDGGDYGSYLSYIYGANTTSNAFETSEYSPFNETQATAGATTPMVNANDCLITRSPDIKHNPAGGSFTVNTAGNYFIAFFVTVLCASGSGTVVIKIKKNGSAIFETAALFMSSTEDNEAACIHTVATLAAGDVIDITVTPASVGMRARKGTGMVMLRVNGHYGAGRYTAAGSAISSADNLKTFDSGMGGIGTVATTTNGVTFTASGGKFTPSAERMFMMMQTLVCSVGGTVSQIENRLTLENSTSAHGFMDILFSGGQAASDPFCSTQQIMKAVPANMDVQPTRGYPGGVTTAFTFEKGTCFTMFDISNNGSVPRSFINIVAKDTDNSNALGLSGWTNVFKTVSGAGNAGHWPDDCDFVDPNDDTNKAVPDGEPDIVAATIGGNRGITFNKLDGKFTFSESGDYLICLSIGLLDSDGSGTVANSEYDLSKNGESDTTGAYPDSSTRFARGNFFVSSDFDPVTGMMMVIHPFENGDHLMVGISSANGLELQDGTSIMITRLGPTRVPQTGFDQLFDGGSNGTGQPIVQTDNTIDSADKGDQRDRRTEQSPFRMAVNGPLTLRGRARSSLPFSVGAGKRGDEK